MGNDEKTPLKLDFDSKVRVEFRGATITSDAGLLACRELDDALSPNSPRDDYAAAERAIGAREGDGPGTIWGRGGPVSVFSYRGETL